MPRTTEELVAGIFEWDEEIPLLPFIVAANELVEEHCASATKADGSLWHTDERLELIERWLSAHFAAIYSPRVRAESVSSLNTVFESKIGFGLDLTRYGQQVKLLDSSGALAALDQMAKGTGKRARFKAWHLGKELE